MNSTVPAPDIADRLGRLHGRVAHGGAVGFRHAGRRRFLDHLLVAALQRAVALEQMDGVAVLSPKTCTSMWRGLSRIFRSARGHRRRRLRLALAPRALFEIHRGLSTRRMPLPPPPATALISTG
jgi:hypothetical protein